MIKGDCSRRDFLKTVTTATLGTVGLGFIKPLPNRPGSIRTLPDSQLAGQRMRRFDNDWRFIRDDAPGAELPGFKDGRWRKLDLPHDWSVEDLPKSEYDDAIGPFTRESPGAAATGHVMGGVGWYRKHFTLSENDRKKQVSIYFEGVYMDADIWINGTYLGNHPYGYTSYAFDLTPHLESENVLSVRVRNIGKNSRWYSGSGIYRHVWMIVTNPFHVDQWGLFVTTPVVNEESAIVQVESAIVNATGKPETVTVHTRLTGPDGRQAGESGQITVLGGQAKSSVTQAIKVSHPSLWSPDSPELYRAEIEVSAGEKILDRAETTFGIRSISVDAEHGLLLNGNPILLKGGCMHHANGPLGSAAIDRAEERRVELMKAHGFNAIRTSHNPPSPAFLDACDRLGMIVIDEAFDCWEHPKNPFDYNKYFDDWWKRDIESMVKRDRNHPSVVFWSIGNEIYERADPKGLEIGRNLIDTVKSLDPTRPVTEAICSFWDHPGRPWSSTAPAFALLDVGGYNYQWKQYEPDHKTFPERVMMGTESVPMEALENWDQVEKHSWVIGDFVWTGMDYLGESGIGHATPDDRKDTFVMPWPWFDSYCGDIDICGFKKPQSYYRDVVWRRSKLEMAVHAPLPSGRKEKISYWGWPDERQNWNWSGNEGKPMHVRVFTRYPAVRLELNGKEIDTKQVTKGITVEFEVPYEPGELKAVGLDNGKELAYRVLKTSGKPRNIRLAADRAEIHADRNDLAYITVEIVDKDGNRVPDANASIHLEVSGEGELAATGNGDPSDMRSFRNPECETFRGRCLAIVRPSGNEGRITLKASAKGYPSTAIKIQTKTKL